MHEDPNEAPTSQRVRTKADLDMYARDMYESRLMRMAPHIFRATGVEWPESRAEALRSLCGEGELPPPTWRPASEAEEAVLQEFGLPIPPLPEIPR